MTTDFSKNALNTTGGIMPGTTDTPGDVRTRVETEADIMNIPNPYLGMIVYVVDTGKRFEVTKLKDKKSGFTTVKNALVDTYVEYDPSKDKGYAKADEVDAALEGKADKADLEGLASEEFVEGKVDEVVGEAPVEFDTLAEVAAELAKKVDKVEGKSLVDDAEIERLSQVDNYNDQELRDAIAAIEIPDVSKFVEEEVIDQKIEDAKFDDAELKGRLDALEAIDHDAFLTEHQAIDHLAVKEEVDAALELKADKSEIPSLEGFATEEFVQEKIDAIPVYDDSEVISRIEGLEAIDHEEFLKEHQDISHLAVKADMDAALELKADKTALEGLASEEFVQGKIADLVGSAPDTLNTLQEIAEAFEAHEDVYDAYIKQVNDALDTKVDAEDGKALMDVAEMERLAGVDNYDDSEVKGRLDAIEAIDHSVFLTEHQDISHLAAKVDVEEEAARAKAVEQELTERVFDLESKERYRISNVPAGTLVDYREKEIRIMCPENAVFEMQEVGAGGNANMYYMTFTTYAPEDAVMFREGDKGELINEYLDFQNTTGAGIDKYGRKYKQHWFALASYNAEDGTWNYFGKNSTAEKYIGWTYCVEYYNANGEAIEYDCIRINLSNQDCHAIMEPHYIAPIKASLETKADGLYVDGLNQRLIALEEREHHTEPKFEYAVNMIAENEPASFTVTGEFPNLVITLNLPQCFSYKDPSAGKMWIGWIPYDESGVAGFNEPDDIGAFMSMDTIQQGIDNGTIVEMEPQLLSRVSIGSVDTEAGFICAIFPEDLNYVVRLDNGLGGKLNFDEINSEDGGTGFMFCQNGTRMVNKIDDVAYCLYGAYVFSPGERFIYIEED